MKGGVSGLFDGAEVVLGPDSNDVVAAPEQQFINQKMRPGSGVLSVQVLPDGPTRVLQVGHPPTVLDGICKEMSSCLSFTLCNITHTLFQISDFNQRRMNRLSPSIEDSQTKESTESKVPDEELEVQKSRTADFVHRK